MFLCTRPLPPPNVHVTLKVKVTAMVLVTHPKGNARVAHAILFARQTFKGPQSLSWLFTCTSTHLLPLQHRLYNKSHSTAITTPIDTDPNTDTDTDTTSHVLHLPRTGRRRPPRHGPYRAPLRPLRRQWRVGLFFFFFFFPLCFTGGDGGQTRHGGPVWSCIRQGTLFCLLARRI